MTRRTHREWHQAAPSGAGDGTRDGLEILAGCATLLLLAVAFWLVIAVAVASQVAA